MSQAPTVHIKKFFAAAKNQVALAKKGDIKKTGSSLIRIQGVDTAKDVAFYQGKKIMYMYRTKTVKDGSRFRVMWGKVCGSHGTSGIVRAKFTKNLPPSAIGGPVRIMLFPSRV